VGRDRWAFLEAPRRLPLTHLSVRKGDTTLGPGSTGTLRQRAAF
jgi:hypothetical protein